MTPKKPSEEKWRVWKMLVFVAMLGGLITSSVNIVLGLEWVVIPIYITGFVCGVISERY